MHGNNEETDILDILNMEEGSEEVINSLLEEIPENKPVNNDKSNRLKEKIKKQAEENKKNGVKEEIVSSPTIYPGSFNPISSSIPIPVPAATVAAQTPVGKALANPLENDKLLETIKSNKSATTLLRSIMEEIAEEAAFIKAWRNEHYGTGEDLSEATFKRIRMLKHLVETLIEQEKIKKENNSGKVDFHGEAFQKVLKHFLEVIQKTFRKINIPIQYEDIFFHQLAKDFDGFEKTAERLYYGKE